MAKSPFIPSTDSDFLRWLENLAVNLPQFKDTLGIPDELIAKIAGHSQTVSEKFRKADAASAAAKAANADKAESRRLADGEARGLARWLKAHPQYQTSIGQILGIEGAEDTTDLGQSRPDVFATNLGGGRAEIAFSKSISHGVNVYGWREGDGDFGFLARDNASPYFDERPPLVPGKPEIRRYKLVYVVSDREVGQFSAIAEVVVTP